MPSRQRWQRPQPACTSTVMRSPISNSSTVGPSFTTVPMYSWPGVKPLLKGDPPSMIAGSPCLMISMSVAQTAMASMRTSTSARPGSGTGVSTRLSSSGPPSTQAFMVLGILNALVCDAMCELPRLRLSWSIGRGRPWRRPSRPILAEPLQAALGQSVVIEAVTGAGGAIGITRVARSAPDGYTIISGNQGSHITLGAVQQVSFDLLRDFAPVVMFATTSQLILVRNSLDVANLRELLALIRANPGKLTDGGGGYGTVA